ncbi:hypothetical protein TUST1-15_00910 [Vibrio phage ICP1_2005_A]|nr:hypothetical protein TUST1-159_00890 [Vibrio phage ICP1_2006_B]ADX88904.1 hypothetical protein TUST1-17_00890 [Vibrio phage ICP1_2006_A]ADX89134.1 hypothetical protein TUST1-15_00910 [Vibrio phage ICP1_2005_A]
MGWGYGVLGNGKEIGYCVEAVCEHEGCGKKIDRGLSHACGGMHGQDEYSCEGYFCEEHCQNYLLTFEGNFIKVCDKCKDILLEDGEMFYDENEDCLFHKDDLGES